MQKTPETHQTGWLSGPRSEQFAKEGTFMLPPGIERNSSTVQSIAQSVYYQDTRTVYVTAVANWSP